MNLIELFLDQSKFYNYDQSFYYDNISTAFQEFNNKIYNYFTFIFNFWDSGDLGQKYLVKYLTDEDFYKKLIVNEENEMKKPDHVETTYSHKVLNEKFYAALVTVHYPDEFPRKDLVKAEFKTLLDEFLFWWVIIKTPDNLTNFFTRVLSDPDVRKRYLSSYLSKYCLIDNLGVIFNMTSQYSYSILSNQIVNLLFGDKNLIEKQDNVFDVLLIALYNHYNESNVLIADKLQSKEENKNRVIDLSHNLLQHSNSHLTLMVPVDHLNLILKHKSMSFKFASNMEYVKMLANFISHLQGMNFLEKPLEDVNYYIDFPYEKSMEIEKGQSSFVMWSLVNSYDGNEHLDITMNVIDQFKEKLFNWFQLISLSGDDGKRNLLNKNQVVFHLPLHRFYSTFMYKALYQSNKRKSLEDVLTKDESKLLNLLAHPLLLQSKIHEANADLWSFVHVCKPIIMLLLTDHSAQKSLNDCDLFLIQSVACHLQPDVFVRTVFEQFMTLQLAKDLLNSTIDEQTKELSEVQRTQMMYGALTTLAHLITREISLDLFDKRSIKNEVIQTLSREDCQFSAIETKIPQTWHWDWTSKDLEAIIDEVADCVQPDYTYSMVLKDSKYILKAKYWETDYDPLFYWFYRSEFEAPGAFERYTNYVKTKELASKTCTLWPPYRIPSPKDNADNPLRQRFRAANSKTLHSILFTLLYKRLNTDKFDPKTISLAIFLIDVALSWVSVTEY